MYIYMYIIQELSHREKVKEMGHHLRMAKKIRKIWGGKRKIWRDPPASSLRCCCICVLILLCVLYMCCICVLILLCTSVCEWPHTLVA